MPYFPVVLTALGANRRTIKCHLPDKSCNCRNHNHKTYICVLLLCYLTTYKYADLCSVVLYPGDFSSSISLLSVSDPDSVDEALDELRRKHRKGRVSVNSPLGKLLRGVKYYYPRGVKYS